MLLHQKDAVIMKTKTELLGFSMLSSIPYSSELDLDLHASVQVMYYFNSTSTYKLDTN